MEGRGQPGGSLGGVAKDRTPSRVPLSPNLARVNEAARKDKGTRFTALLHHVNAEALERAFRGLKRCASAGVDGETVASYEEDLGRRLQDLLDRVHRGSYRALPVRRVYIPKADGGQRPLGIPALEDKIVQGAVAEVLGAIYEADFAGFSYGFRPGRNQHEALKALRRALLTQQVSWVLDADFRNYFGSVGHEELMRWLAHRIADRRILRLIGKWLKAGVLEDGEWQSVKAGTPQGAIISPLLSNVFLHYVLDVWVQEWRRRQARGRVIIVRYADDFVMGFKHEEDARKMLAELQGRLAQHGLALHGDKTRLIEFGRGVAQRRAEQGERRPGTFTFLGLTHYWGKTRTGRWDLRWKTARKRLAVKLQAVREEARRRMHATLADQHKWLASVLLGHYRYYGVTGNYPALRVFYQEARRHWFRALRRRGGKVRLTWDRFEAWLDRFPLPRPRIVHTQTFFAWSLG